VNVDLQFLKIETLYDKIEQRDLAPYSYEDRVLNLMSFSILADLPGLLSRYNSIEHRKDLIDDLRENHGSFRRSVKFDELHLNHKNGALSDELFELANYVDKLFMFMILKVNSSQL